MHLLYNNYIPILVVKCGLGQEYTGRSSCRGLSTILFYGKRDRKKSAFGALIGWFISSALWPIRAPNMSTLVFVEREANSY